MTDRKQEVIAAIAEGFPGIGLSHSGCLAYAKNIYDSIAPLMQERITWAVASRKDRTIITIRDDGEEVYSHSCPTRYIADLSNGVTCQKCGGGGRISDLEREQPEDLDICPNCKGTEDCQHQDLRIAYWHSLKTKMPYCNDCERLVERRSEDDRRKGKDERRILGTFRQFVLEDTEDYYRLAGNHDNVAQIEQRLMTTWRRNIPDRRK